MCCLSVFNYYYCYYTCIGINGNSNDNNVIMNRPNCEEDEDSDSRSIIESDTSDHKKPKRTRTAFTSTQLDQLEIYFSDSIYPDAFVRDDISKQLHIKEDRIQVYIIIHVILQGFVNAVAIIILLLLLY